MNNGVRRSNRPAKLEQPMLWASSPERYSPRLSIAWISRPRVGETVCGDAVLVREHGNDGGVLVALIDALGHGPKAADVAQTSTEWLGSTASSGDNAPALVHGLHRALSGSRGAAALIVLFTSKGVEACSVGNVELRTTGKLPFVLTPGVLGVRLRPPRICFADGPINDRFVAYSDGISGRFDLKSLRSYSPSELATHIFATHRHEHDDASVVVIDVE
jgi:negative regulator of sigma-B (phosphoserine phosphatase)